LRPVSILGNQKEATDSLAHRASNIDKPQYHRTERTVGINFKAKLYQGIGSVPSTINGFVFSTFLLLYYNQILGIDARYVSIALGIAVFFDAVSDPIIAAYSDNLQTRWGRRHPLMLMSAVPLGLCIFAIFVPPAFLTEGQKIMWLLFFCIFSGLFSTLFNVPWNAVAAELSDDYAERTSIMSYRYAVGWVVGISFPLFIFSFVMPETEGQAVGQLNPEGYPVMAALAGILAALGALASTLLTSNQIPYLRQHIGEKKPLRIGKVFAELKRAVGNNQFALIFTIVFFSSAIGGTLLSLGIYMSTYFWGFGTEDLRWFTLSALGALLAFPFVDYIQERWDKKQIMLFCAIASLADGLLWVNLRLLDVLPENGDPWLLTILVVSGTFTTFIAVIDGIIGASIVADILDEHELETGHRQEGMFYAALTFSEKAVGSIGIATSGFLIASLQLPKNAVPGKLDAELVFNMGLIAGVLIPLFYIIPIYLIRFYKITRERHREIQKQLILARNS